MTFNRQSIVVPQAHGDEWFDFTNKVRKEKKTVWEVLRPYIKEYMTKEGKL